MVDILRIMGFVFPLLLLAVILYAVLTLRRATSTKSAALGHMDESMDLARRNTEIAEQALEIHRKNAEVLRQILDQLRSR